MRRFLILAILSICMVFAFAACGFDSAPIEKELSSCSWHVDKQDKDDHTLSYQYVFKDGKVDIEYVDITNASGIGPYLASAETKKVGTFDYEINKESIVIHGDSDEEIPYTFEDNILKLDGGKYFTLAQAETNLRGKWVSSEDLGLIAIKTTLTFKDNGVSSVMMTSTMSGYVNHDSTYEVFNGYIKNLETETKDEGVYFYTFDGTTLSLIGFDHE